MAFIVMSLAVISVVPRAVAQDPAADSDTHPRDTVMASLLVASPGKEIYQVAGHGAIRMQAPRFGLDNVFSFETDNAGGLPGQLFGQAKGRYAAVVTSEYLDLFRQEGRSVTEYPLNLTDPQIRTLWRLLDEAVESGSEIAFNIRRDNCYYRAFVKVEDALGRDKIVMHESHYSLMDNGTLLKSVLEKDTPWAAVVFVVGTGGDTGESDSWRTLMFSSTIDSYFRDAEIESPDGSTRPLLAEPPSVLLPATGQLPSPSPVTPAVACLGLLVLALALSVAEVAGRWCKIVKVADVILLSLESLGAVALILMAVIPASIGSAWNWMMIPLNLLPPTVWLACRRRAPRFCRAFFIAYGVVSLLFTAAPLLTSEAGLWSSLLSAAIAIRVLTHYLPRRQAIREGRR